MKLGETDKPDFYKDAIEFHNKHKEIADVAGKFLAHINLGIIYNNVGDHEKATINHHFALRYAVQMSSVAGQSVAIGNLGKVGGKNMQTTMLNQDKMQMFVERYLELSNELKYRKGESGAYLQLGELLTQKGDFDTSTKHFYRAMKIAEETGDGDLKEAAKVNFGMAKASNQWTNHVSAILNNLQESSNQEGGAGGLHAVEDEGEDEGGEGVFGNDGAMSADEAERKLKLPQIGK
jgi:tetratricopeptide (TPR) repeat protein